MNKRRVFGICILLLGVVLAIGLLVSQYLHCVDMWVKEGKNAELLTATDYFVEVSGGAILISGLLMALFALLGVVILPHSGRKRLD